MDGKWFLLIYVVYIVLLFLGYRILVKRIEKKKLQKKLDQERKLKGENPFEKLTLDKKLELAQNLNVEYKKLKDLVEESKLKGENQCSE